MAQNAALIEETRVLEQAFDAVSNCVLTLHEGQILRANRSGRELLRHAQEDVVRLIDGLPKTRSIQISGHHYELRDRNPVELDGQQVTVVTLQDVSERHALLEKRRKSRTVESSRTQAELKAGLGQSLQRVRQRLVRLQHIDPVNASTLGNLVDLTDLCLAQIEAIPGESLLEIRCAESFATALGQLSREFEEVFDFQVLLESSAFPPLDHPSHWSELYRIVQEGLRNAWRHSGGTQATLTFQFEVFEIHDNGSGLDEDCFDHAGVGMYSIIDRAREIGFDAAIAPPPANGWRFNRRSNQPR